MVSTSSRNRVMVSASRASTLSRSSGSVLEGLRLIHQPARSSRIVSPSQYSTPPRPSNTLATRSIAARWSVMVELISPERS